jgi:glucosylceramidase
MRSLARVYLTARDGGHRLTKVSERLLEPRTRNTSIRYIFIDPTIAFGTLRFIGGSINNAVSETFNKLPQRVQDQFLEAQFHPVLGNGYTGIRTPIGPCDFEPYPFSYIPDDAKDLRDFSTERDLEHKIPMIIRSDKIAGGTSILASTWSPPKQCKSNDDICHGGSLRPEFREFYSEFLLAFIHDYGRRGVRIWGLSPQNEPEAVQRWPSCIYTPEEERDFMRDFIGPALERSAHWVKLIAWDHNRDLMYERARVILSDRKARQFVWGLGFHWYSHSCYDNVALVHKTFPRTHLIFTEAAHGPFKITELNNWPVAERYATAMIHDLNNGAEGWLDWNILLDEKGGPNYVGNYCHAPVHAINGELVFTCLFYYIGHFSKFIRPGFRLIPCSSSSDDLLATAFGHKASGKIATVILNKQELSQAFTLALNDEMLPLELPPRSIATVVIETK